MVDYWAAKQKNRDGRGSFAQFGFAPQFAPNFHRSCRSTQQFIWSLLSECPSPVIAHVKCVKILVLAGQILAFTGHQMRQMPKLSGNAKVEVTF